MRRQLVTLAITGLVGLGLGAGVGVAAAQSSGGPARPSSDPTVDVWQPEHMDAMHASMRDRMPPEFAKECDAMHSAMGRDHMGMGADHMGSGEMGSMMGRMGQAGSQHGLHHN